MTEFLLPRKSEHRRDTQGQTRQQNGNINYERNWIIIPWKWRAFSSHTLGPLPVLLFIYSLFINYSQLTIILRIVSLSPQFWVR